jgi:hypothetical protein
LFGEAQPPTGAVITFVKRHPPPADCQFSLILFKQKLLNFLSPPRAFFTYCLREIVNVNIKMNNEIQFGGGGGMHKQKPAPALFI